MKNRITKTETRSFLKSKLGTSKTWAKAVLLKIYDFQTETEQQMETTNCDNGVGFTGTDAKILSSFAEQLIKRKFLSPKQMSILMKKMPKYWKQVLKISDSTKLERMLITERFKIL